MAFWSDIFQSEKGGGGETQAGFSQNHVRVNSEWMRKWRRFLCNNSHHFCILVHFCSVGMRALTEVKSSILPCVPIHVPWPKKQNPTPPRNKQPTPQWLARHADFSVTALSHTWSCLLGELLQLQTFLLGTECQFHTRNRHNNQEWWFAGCRDCGSYHQDQHVWH